MIFWRSPEFRATTRQSCNIDSKEVIPNKPESIKGMNEKNVELEFIVPNAGINRKGIS